MIKKIRLGTRGSPLALIQAEIVKNRLLTRTPELLIEIFPMHTKGDWQIGQQEQRLLDRGGNKGLFTKEIDDALQNGHIDMAIHSMKDVESWLPDNLEIAAILERQDPRDAFMSDHAGTLAGLPSGSTVGTSSPRRQAQILARRPDLRVVPLRGNVDTRLKKLSEGLADATLLAVAGLIRLGVADRIKSILDTDTMLPAAAQGAIGIEIRRGDENMRHLLSPLNCLQTAICVHAERALLKTLDGSCETPIAALATLVNPDQMRIEALAAKPDGTSLIRLDQTGPIEKAQTIAVELGHRLKNKLPADFFLL